MCSFLLGTDWAEMKGLESLGHAVKCQDWTKGTGHWPESEVQE